MKLKKPTRRQTLNRKYNIQKKVKEHNRKIKKHARVAKKSGLVSSKNRSKDPGVPNSWPFKQEVLNDIERRKAESEAAKKKEKDLRKKGLPVHAPISKKRQDKVVKSISEMKADAEKRTRLFDRSADALIGDSTSVRDMHEVARQGATKEARNTRRAYYRELRKVIAEANVVVQVLDARDPMSCRCQSLEDAVRESGKKMILLLNKIDLVPKDAVLAWMKYLGKQGFPTIAFKAARNKADRQTGRAIAFETASDGLLNSSSAVVGSDALLQLLKLHAKGTGTGRISVGIVGYPNVGKSSVINSMKRGKGVQLQTGNKAGVTKKMQEVQLDGMISLIDSPGVVFASSEESASNTSSLVIRQSVNVDALEDPMPVVEAIVKRTPRNAVLKHFKIPGFESVLELVGHVARSRGKLRRGGAPDMKQGAKDLLREWTSGRLRFFCLPPVDKSTSFAEVVESAQPEMDIEALFKGVDPSAAGHAATTDCMGVDVGMVDDEDVEVEGSEDEGMGEEEEEEEEAPVLIDAIEAPSDAPAPVEKSPFTGLNPRTNLEAKKKAKEEKKRLGKKARRGLREEGVISDASNGGDAYDFKRDFN